jgi:hypothetical protein
MSSEGGSFTRVGFLLGSDWRVYCHAYDDTTPILDISAGSSSVAFSVRGRVADQAAVEFARALLHNAQQFADEMERKHAAQLADDSSTTTDKAAGSDAA